MTGGIIVFICSLMYIYWWIMGRYFNFHLHIYIYMHMFTQSPYTQQYIQNCTQSAFGPLPVSALFCCHQNLWNRKKGRKGCASSPAIHWQLSAMVTTVSPSSHCARLHLQQKKNNIKRWVNNAHWKDNISVYIAEENINKTR